MLMETGISKKDQVSELLDPVSVDTSHNRRIQCNCARSSQVLLRAKYDGPVGKPKCSASRLAAMLAMSKSDSEGLTQLGAVCHLFLNMGCRCSRSARHSLGRRCWTFAKI